MQTLPLPYLYSYHHSQKQNEKRLKPWFVYRCLTRQAPVSGHIQVTTLVAAYESHSQKRPDLVMDTLVFLRPECVRIR